MQRPTKRTRVLCRARQQMDLFAGEVQNAVGDMPTWSGLPADLQAALSKLSTIDLGTCREEPDFAPSGGDRP
jgi:hypothetical protein